MPRITPAFELEELPGEVERVRCFYKEKKTGRNDKHGNPIITHELVREKVREPAGYMAYFPRGHSIRVRDDAHLRELGLDRDPYLIDASGELTDEDVARQYGSQTGSLKRNSQIQAAANKRGKAAAKAAAGTEGDQLANPEGD